MDHVAGTHICVVLSVFIVDSDGCLKNSLFEGHLNFVSVLTKIVNLEETSHLTSLKIQVNIPEARPNVTKIN